jgi:uncharacterized protein HemX
VPGQPSYGQPGEPTVAMGQGSPYAAAPSSGLPAPDGTQAYPPVSGGPAYQPVSDPPTYPVSGGPYAPGTFPAYGGPVTAPGPVGGAPRRRGGVVVLAVFAVLFLLATGVLTALYITKSSEADRNRRELTAQVRERDSTLSARAGEIDQLKKELEAKTEELDEAKRNLTGSQNQVTELNRQKDVIAKCIRLLSEEKPAEAEPFCNEADRILGF